MDIKRPGLVLFVFLWLSGSSHAAPVCPCGSAGAPCAVFSQAATVFAGRVESISTSDSATGSRVGREVRFRVLERFRGASGPEVSLLAEAGVCRVRFTPGRDYFVYASRDETSGRLMVSACSGTRPLEDAATDLSYARGALGGATQAARVSGTIAFDGRPGAPPALMEATTIVLAKNGEETRTPIDRHGRFVVEGLGAGAYQVRLDAPIAFYGQVWPNQVLLAPRGCVELTGWIRYNGRLRGRVTDHSGVPVVGLTVEVAVRGRTKAISEHDHAVTGSDGVYELSGIPPGEYVLGVNMNGTMNDGADRPVPSAFYPGVSRLADARRVRLSGGQSLALGDFVLPRETGAVRLSGVVLDPDGGPAAGARVFLKGASEIDYVVADPVTTDTDGRFVIAAFANSRYRLFAERDRGGSRLDSSDEIPIMMDRDLLPIRVLLRRRY